MDQRRVFIAGTGKFLPKRVVLSSQLDAEFSKSPGWAEKRFGIRQRHFVDQESSSGMAAYAAHQAVKNANISLHDIDCIVSACSVMEQPIPGTASLIQKKLFAGITSVPCIDINTTCLSFLTAFDTFSYLVDCNKYRTVLIVSSEIASCGLDRKDPETACLFGDGAAAAVIRKTNDNQGSHVIASLMETYSKGYTLCELQAGGTQCNPRRNWEKFLANSFFKMNGKGAYQLSAKIMPDFIKRLLNRAQCTLDDIDVVIPHQASHLALEHLVRRVGIPEEKVVNILPTHGNQIAASIPSALHEAIVQGRIDRGHKVMIVGLSAGISVGGMVLRF